MAEKRWPQEEKSAHNGQEARPRSLKGRESNERNPETGAAGKKNEKTSDALDTGGGACGYKVSPLRHTFSPPHPWNQ